MYYYEILKFFFFGHDGRFFIFSKKNKKFRKIFFFEGNQ
jgi:hypothetical protein